MNTRKMKNRAKRAAREAGNAVRGALGSIGNFVDEHRLAIQVAANAGLYVGGVYVVAKSTGVAMTVGGAAMAIVGAVGLGACAAEYLWPKPEDIMQHGGRTIDGESRRV